MASLVKNKQDVDKQNKGKNVLAFPLFIVILYCLVLFVFTCGIIFTLTYFVELQMPENYKHYIKNYDELSEVFDEITPGIDTCYLMFTNDVEVPEYFYFEEEEFRNYLECNNYETLGNKITFMRPLYIILGEHDIDDVSLDLLLRASGYCVIDKKWDNFRVYKNIEEEKQPYYIDMRECIVFGETAEEFCYQFPYCTYETEIPIEDYPTELLLDKKVVIYFASEYKSLYEVERVENKLLEIERAGVHVLIEPNYEARLRLFDVRMQYIEAESPLTVFCTEQTPYQFQRIIILESQKEKIGGFYGTNVREMTSLLEMQNGLTGTTYPIIGTMNIDGVDLTFIGNKLSEYILPVYVRGFGKNAKNYSNAIQNSKKISELFEDLMDYFEIRKENYFVSPLGDNNGLNKEQHKGYYKVILPMKFDRHYKAYADGKETDIINQEGMMAVVVENPNSLISLSWSFTLKDYSFMFLELLCVIVFAELIFGRKRFIRNLVSDQLVWKEYFEQSSDSSNE